jgi:hypothetical protein
MLERLRINYKANNLKQNIIKSEMINVNAFKRNEDKDNNNCSKNENKNKNLNENYIEENKDSSLSNINKISEINRKIIQNNNESIKKENLNENLNELGKESYEGKLNIDKINNDIYPTALKKKRKISHNKDIFSPKTRR